MATFNINGTAKSGKTAKELKVQLWAAASPNELTYRKEINPMTTFTYTFSFGTTASVPLLQIRLYDLAGKELGRSEIVTKGKLDETFTLNVTDTSLVATPTIDFTNTNDKIAPLLGKTNPATITETQITAWSTQTGVAASKIRSYLTGQIRFTALSSTAEILYGLQEQAFKVDDLGFSAYTYQNLADGIRNAIKTSLITTKTDAEIDSLAAAMAKVAVFLALPEFAKLNQKVPPLLDGRNYAYYTDAEFQNYAIVVGSQPKNVAMYVQAGQRYGYFGADPESLYALLMAGMATVDQVFAEYKADYFVNTLKVAAQNKQIDARTDADWTTLANAMVEKGKINAMTDYELVYYKLAPFLDGRDPALYTSDDVNTLAIQAGLGTSLAQNYVKALLFEKKYAVGAVYAYGLIYMGISILENDLLAVSKEQFYQHLLNASNTRGIPAQTETQLRDAALNLSELVRKWNQPEFDRLTEVFSSYIGTGDVLSLSDQQIADIQTKNMLDPAQVSRFTEAFHSGKKLSVDPVLAYALLAMNVALDPMKLLAENPEMLAKKIDSAIANKIIQPWPYESLVIRMTDLLAYCKKLIQAAEPVYSEDSLYMRIEAAMQAKKPGIDPETPLEKLALQLCDEIGFGPVETAAYLQVTQFNPYNIDQQVYFGFILLGYDTLDEILQSEPGTLSMLMDTAINKGLINWVYDADYQQVENNIRQYIYRLKKEETAAKNEFDQVAEKLESLVSKLPSADLKGAQLEMLKEKSGLDETTIRRFLKANNTVIRSKKAAFALAAQGIELTPAALGKIKFTDLANHLKKAADSGIVQISDLEAEMEQINQDLAEETLYKAGTFGKYSLSDLLDAAGVPNQWTEADQQVRKRLAAHFNKAGDPDTFLTQITTDKQLSALVPKVKSILEFSIFTDNHLPAAAKMMAAPEIASTADMTAYKYHDFLDMVRGVKDGKKMEVPEHISAETEAIREEIYADELARKVEANYPMEVVQQGLKAAGTTNKGATALAGFLSNNKNFNLATTPVDKYLTENPDALNGVSGVTAADLKTAQRQYRMTSGTDKAGQIAALNSAGYATATEVSKVSRKKFVKQMNASNVASPKANEMYDQAVLISKVAKGMVTRQMPGVSPRVAVAFRPEDYENDPTLHALFGSMDTCDCESCRSMNSPAAYLVELLNFVRDLNNEDDTTGRQDSLAYQELKRRRPDIWNIRLNCSNAMTAMPYIDLVIEILEQALIAQTNTNLPANEFQTTRTAEELAANPENIREEAYSNQHLLNLTVPWALPFDRYNQEAMAYLGHLGYNKAELLASYAPFTGIKLAASGVENPYKPDVFGQIPQHQFDSALTLFETIHYTADSSWIAEVLNLSGDDALAMTKRDSATLLKLWSGRSAETIKSAFLPELMRLSGLSYEEIILVPDMWYLNLRQPFANRISLKFDASDPCNHERAIFSNLDKAGFYALFPGFVRLARRSGFTLLELDQILRALNVTSIEADSLSKLAILRHTLTKYELELPEVLHWIGDFHLGHVNAYAQQNGQPTEYKWVKGSYQSRFQSGSLGQIPAAFVAQISPDNTTLSLGGTSFKMGQYIDFLSAAISCQAKEIQEVFRLDSELKADSPVNLKFISRLCRILDFCKKFDLSVADYYLFSDLIGTDAFAETAKAEKNVLENHFPLKSLMLYAEQLQRLRNGNVSLDLLAYLSAHDRIESPELSESNLLELLQNLQSGIRRVVASYQNQFELDHELLRNKWHAFFNDPNRVNGIFNLFGKLEEADILENKAFWNNSPIPNLLREALASDGLLTTDGFLTSDWLTPERTIKAAVLKEQEEHLYQPFTEQSIDEVIDKLINRLKARTASRKDIFLQFCATYKATSGVDLFHPISFSPKEIETWMSFVNQVSIHQFLFDYIRKLDILKDVKTYIQTKLPGMVGLSTEIGAILLTGISSFKPVLYANPIQAIQSRNTQGKPSGKGLLDVWSDEAFITLNLTQSNAMEHLHSMRCLYKAALFITEMRMNAAELTEWLAQSGSLSPNALEIKALDENSSLDLKQTYRENRIKRFLQIQWWQNYRTLDQLWLRKNVMPSLNTMQILALTKANTETSRSASVEKYLEQLALHREISMNAWFYLIKNRKVSLASLSDPANVLNMLALSQILSQIGLSNQVLGWEGTWPINWSFNKDSIAVLRNAVKSHYSDRRWPEVASEIMSPVRSATRTALLSGLMHLHPELKTEDDVYAYYLIDPGMEPVMKTSRIRLALSSVQLFVQRLNLNLEEKLLDKIHMDDDDLREWEWMKNYRVWEANRKVFLYPENYIEPSLRKDNEKTPFFKELESELNQGELTNERAEQIFVNYLLKLGKVSNLDVEALHNSLEDGTNFVFAKTKNEPFEYYFRRANAEEIGTAGRNKKYAIRDWTPWEQVNLDFGGSKHILPIVFHERLYLFWFTFNDKPYHTSEVYNHTNDFGYKLDSNYKEIKLFYSRYQPGEGWTETTSYPQKFHSKILNLSRKVEKFSTLKIWIKISSQEYYAARNEAIRTNPDMNNQGSVPNGYRIVWGVGPFKEISLLNYFPETFKLDNTRVDLWFLKYRIDFEINEFKKQYPGFAENPGLKAIYDENQRIAEVIDQEVMSVSENSRFYFDAELQSSEVVGIYTEEISIGVFFDDGMGDEYKRDLRNLGTFRMNAHGQIVLNNKDAMRDVSMISDKNSLILNQKTFVERKPEIPYGVSTFNEFYGEHFTVLNQKKDVGQIQLVRDDNFGISWQRNYVYQDGHRSFLMEAQSGKFKVHRLNYPISNLMLQVTSAKDGILNLLSPEQNSVFYRQKIQFDETNQNYELNEDFITNSGELIEKIEFDHTLPYSIYNWEIFFFIPWYIADKFSKAQQFEEAHKWYSLLFNPQANEINTNDVRKYWKFRPFIELYGTDGMQRPQALYNLMRLLSLNEQEIDNEELLALQHEVQETIHLWRNDPFNPHLIARNRISAYQKAVVMKYLDNLLAWGDLLFKRDTMESLNEATQLYMMSKVILGDKPQKTPAINPKKELTYTEFQNMGQDEFGNVLTQTENALSKFYIPHAPSSIRGRFSSSFVSPRFNIDPGRMLDMLYFGVPANDKLLKYWDTVADRMFKLRNSLNLQGVFRQLPVYDPPIDPSWLVRAKALGMDLNDVLSDYYAPLPAFRFSFLIQRALGYCQDLRSLGSALLSALEKRDNEQLNLIRSDQALKLVKETLAIKRHQIKEAIRNLEGLEYNKENLEYRRDYYAGKDFMDAYETNEMITGYVIKGLKKGAKSIQGAVGVMETGPGWIAGSAGSLSSPVALTNWSPSKAAAPVKTAAKVMDKAAEILELESAFVSKMGGYHRRYKDYKFQAKSAENDLKATERRILASEIRLAILEKELENHELQIQNAEEILHFYKDKFTGYELYDWMVGQLSTLYFQTYQMAYDFAKRAEKAYEYEVVDNKVRFVDYGYWDNLKKGLLAGDLLYQDLKRMEMASLDQQKRGLEITKNITLAQISPESLINLRKNGICEFEIPEMLFDLDYPGHFKRKIKSVTISIPAITGPYTSVNCKLTMLKNRIRIKNETTGKYEEKPGTDSRFRYDLAAVQTMVTSNGINDSGMFEFNLKDDKYLPFEGAGVISAWRMEMPNEFRSFDYNSISDVVLTIRYTASEGGNEFKSKATEYLKRKFKSSETGLYRLFSLKNDFPQDWNRFKNGNVGAEGFAPLRNDQFPYAFRKDLNLNSMEIKSAFTMHGNQLIEAKLEANDLPLSVGVSGGKIQLGAGQKFHLPADPEDILLVLSYKIQ